MRARLIVFPIRGRSWCFGRSIDPSAPESSSSQVPSSLKELWRKISSESKPLAVNAELVSDFIADKMNRAWIGLERAPEGTFKKKLHGLGLRLLARVKPSEILLRSIPKDTTSIQITYPSSLNGRLVRRRLRHIAMRGNVIHKKYFYGSVSLLPLASAFSILPLPNVPFFWILFRTHSHWRALKGSEKLLQLVSNYSPAQNSITLKSEELKTSEGDASKHETKQSPDSPWVLEPSKDLEDLLGDGHENEGLRKEVLADICRRFCLNEIDVLKFRDHL